MMFATDYGIPKLRRSFYIAFANNQYERTSMVFTKLFDPNDVIIHDWKFYKEHV